MKSLLHRLVLERTGPADATVGLVSLPLPMDTAEAIALDHPHGALQPIAWRPPIKEARRALAIVVDDHGVPASLKLTHAAPPAPADSLPWQVKTRITNEKLDFTPHPFKDIPELRGVPAHECTTVEFELLLAYGTQELSLQFGASGPKGGPYYWQNVEIDHLWHNAAAQAVRVGGVIYNEDTYLWADVYLLLFSNGVAHAAAHFVTTKLHIEGYDFQGLPVIRFAQAALPATAASTPADGLRFDLGGLRLNLEDAAVLAGPEHPGQLSGPAGVLLWHPLSGIFNPQLPEWPATEWAPGFARTVRFQFSLSAAAPVVARYTVPAWWYAHCGEPWPFGYLPVHGQFDRLGELTSDNIRSMMVHGRFDGGSSFAGLHFAKPQTSGNDGDSGVGMMQNYYHTGRPELLRDALDYCYYWADIHVDHRDFSVRQWVGGWGWKTCAYSKFRDVLYGYLETGDPYLKDTAEMCAAAYWAWFRTNWPRCTIGRDAFEVGAWALLWRFLGSEHARERSLELARMMGVVLNSRGVIGGQMGAGPHPGYLSSLYMSGVAMVSLLDVAEAALEAGDHATVAALLPLLEKLHEQYRRNDVELFPSSYGQPMVNWQPLQSGIWAAMAVRIYPEYERLRGLLGAAGIPTPSSQVSTEGMARLAELELPALEEWAVHGRLGNQLLHPLYHDALLLGAKLDGLGITINSLSIPPHWPERQVVDTPYGALTITRETTAAATVVRFTAAELFPISIICQDKISQTTSQGTASFAPAGAAWCAV